MDFGFSWPETGGDYSNVAPIYEVKGDDLIGTKESISKNDVSKDNNINNNDIYIDNLNISEINKSQGQNNNNIEGDINDIVDVHEFPYNNQNVENKNNEFNNGEEIHDNIDNDKKIKSDLSENFSNNSGLDDYL